MKSLKIRSIKKLRTDKVYDIHHRIREDNFHISHPNIIANELIISNCGRHAGGIILLDDAESYVPIIKIRGEDQSPISEGISGQFLHHFGLVKFDILGLATLKIINNCIKSILKKEGNKNPSVADVWKFYNENLAAGAIKEDDEKVLKKVYWEGRFPSIFQFSEPGVQNFATKALPKNVEEISALTAIWRPGPLASQANLRYIEANKDINYKEPDHPLIEKLLAPTRNILIFQEQMMLLAHELGGFSLAETDKLRKLLMKPSQELGEEMKKQREEAGVKFIQGCINKGISRERAEKLWFKEILPFVSYSFNASHSVCYAYTSYQCAWLYTYYEKEWIKACLEEDPKPEEAVQVVASLGYKIDNPNINKSHSREWQITDDKRCIPPLTAVKGVGLIAADELIKERRRTDCGAFESLSHMLFTLDEKGKKKFRWSKFNKKCFESLIRIGAFEELRDDYIFHTQRHMYETFKAYFNDIKKGKQSLEDIAKNDVDETAWSRYDMIDIQKELLGTYDKSLLFTPNVNRVLREYDVVPLSDLCENLQLHWFIVKGVEKKKDKRGKTYWKLKIADVDDKVQYLNYFNEDAKVQPNNIYLGKLYKNGQYINLEYNGKIVRLKE